MKRQFPSPRLNFRYAHPPVSGNQINGLGISERVRPLQIFHGSGKRKLEWELLELFFLLTMPFKLFIRGLYSRWILRRADGKITGKQQVVTDAEAMADEIREHAIKLGAGAVGVSAVTELALYQNYATPFKYAISIAYPMNFAIMDKHVARIDGGIETIRAYTEITRIVVKLAEYIRNKGWPARAYCESADLLQIPLAINAGLGQLGKHGSLINRELGSDIRLACVLTDIPLRVDKPVDIGVEDLCRGCRRCSSDCPADAIADKKQLVRGIEKWYVNFDRCVPYFSKTYGCGICIQVCPWSRPGRGPGLSAKLLAKRAA